MSGYDVFDLITGLIGIFSVLYAILERLMPDVRLLSLQQSLTQVDQYLQATIEEGSSDDRSVLQERLRQLKLRHRNLEYRTHCAATFYQQCREMFTGLTRDIIAAHYESKAILAKLTTQRLQSTHPENLPVGGSIDGSLVPIPDGDIASLAYPREAVIRLTNMPASLLVRQSSDAGSVLLRNGPMVLIGWGMARTVQLWQILTLSGTSTGIV
ncbi:hypothetical protein QCA50_021079 [Cerrena zonata]|uniref:Uncharacterized protein n=1 Tax=Cerrena zonata TaxID=2478898 RepID=A0AAW0F8K2_9APHY